MGAGSNADKLHFSPDALHEFGLRYFEVFEALRDPSKVLEEKGLDETMIKSCFETL